MKKTSKIGIGTVQFGVDYGISNSFGKTGEKEVSSIFKLANSVGINLIDTSPAYGNAEEVIGNTFICNKGMNVVTKTVRIESENLTQSKIRNVRESFITSLDKMKKDKVYGLIAHQGYDLCKPGYQYYTELFNDLKAKSIVTKVGASVYNKQELTKIIECCDIDLVQLPLNIFDQDFIESGFLELLKNRGIEIHVRSVFLQGLVFMDKVNLNSYFKPIVSTLDRFQDILNELNISALDASLAFVMNQECIDKVILGIQNIEQMEQIINSVNKNIHLPDVKELSLSGSDFVNPSCWKLGD